MIKRSPSLKSAVSNGKNGFRAVADNGARGNESTMMILATDAHGFALKMSQSYSNNITILF